MTLTLTDARVDVFKPTNTATDPAQADYQIASGDINSIDQSRRLQTLLDTGSLELENQNGKHTGSVTTGDRLVFNIGRENEAGLTPRWTTMGRNLEYEQLSPNRSILTAELEDWVFAVMENRTLVESYTNRQIAGTPDSILNILLDDFAPKIDTSGIGTVTDTMTISWNGANMLDAVNDLADRADAAVWSDGLTLHFIPITEIQPSFGLTPHDKGLHTVRSRDDDLVTQIRVVGGTGVEVDDSQTTQDGYTTVTDTNRITQQIQTRKSEISKIEIWTNKTGSGDNIVVRLQSDSGGAPVDVNDRTSDLARKKLPSDFLATDGYTTFLLPDHDLPNPDPWVIIESEGSVGQDIGINTATSEPTFEAYYSYPLTTIAADESKSNEYGLRESITRRESIKTRTDAIDFARAFLRHSNRPEREFKFSAESIRAHNLTPGDIITVDEPNENAVGEFMITMVDDNYTTLTLNTQLTAQEVDTL